MKRDRKRNTNKEADKEEKALDKIPINTERKTDGRVLRYRKKKIIGGSVI